MSSDAARVLAEFATGRCLLDAVQRLKADGFRPLDAYSPTPVEGLDEALGQQDHTMSKLAFFGGLSGAVAGYGLQYWVSVDAYPINVAGRPLHSWPAFIPITFECTILFASLTLAVGFFLINAYPVVYDPVFQAPEVSRASRDRYCLTVEAPPSARATEALERLLIELGAESTRRLQP
ncbi:MAG: DUF3341 domain-containing protein [Bryobacterales bacterium]